VTADHPPVTDEIAILGLRAFGHHGVFDDEKRDGQEFVIDVRLIVDLAEAASTDDVTTTVHYGLVAEDVVAAVERDPVDLIETVAQRIAEVVLAYERVLCVTVVIHKPSAPITVPFSDVTVTITRSRGGSR
jgi:dihydroneopterin aldolase